MPRKKKRKIKSDQEIGHAAAESNIHKAHQERKRAFMQNIGSWLEVQSEYGFFRPFSKFLGLGKCYVVERDKDTGKEKLVEKPHDLWTEVLEVLRKQRSHERTTRLRRYKLKDGSWTEKEGKIWAPVDPIQETTATPGPHTQTYLYIQLLRFGTKGLETVREYNQTCMIKGREIITSRTGAEVDFITDHSDTDDVHYNWEVCAVDANSKRIAELSLGLVGPATVGYMRHSRLGAISSLNAKRLTANIAKYRDRMEAKGVNTKEGIYRYPLDVHLAMAVDTIAERKFGKDPVFQYCKASYRLWLLSRHNGDPVLIEKVKAILQQLESKANDKPAIKPPPQKPKNDNGPEKDPEVR